MSTDDGAAGRTEDPALADELASIRVEEPAVFDESHRRLLALVGSGALPDERGLASWAWPR